MRSVRIGFGFYRLWMNFEQTEAIELQPQPEIVEPGLQPETVELIQEPETVGLNLQPDTAQVEMLDATDAELFEEPLTGEISAAELGLSFDPQAFGKDRKRP